MEPIQLFFLEGDLFLPCSVSPSIRRFYVSQTPRERVFDVPAVLETSVPGGKQRLRLLLKVCFRDRLLNVGKRVCRLFRNMAFPTLRVMSWQGLKEIVSGLKSVEKELPADRFLQTLVVADRTPTPERFCKPLFLNDGISGLTAFTCFLSLTRTKAEKWLDPVLGLIVLPDGQKAASAEVESWIDRLDPVTPLMVFETSGRGLDPGWLEILGQPERFSEHVLMSVPGKPATLIRNRPSRSVLLRSRIYLPALSALAAARLEVQRPTLTPPPKTPGHTWIIGIFLLQDLNLLLPLIRRCISEGHADLVIVTHWQILAEMPRICRELAALGMDLIILDQEDVRGGLENLSVQAEAVITASDTTAGPHIGAYLLAKWANNAAIPSYTMQHGLENIGLTYRSEAFGSEIRFASKTVFIWGPTESLPAWVSEETSAKAVTSGSPKPVPLANAAEEQHAGLERLSQKWNRVVGIFENLHWERYPEEYGSSFMATLPVMALAFPETLFVIKTHPAGQWLWTHNRRSFLPDLPNLFPLDPNSPEWSDLGGAQLVKAADVIITTPSTVALDAAREGKPVAVIGGHGQDTSPYSPLTVLETTGEWTAFLQDLENPDKRAEIIVRSSEFPARVDVGGDGIGKIIDHISRASAAADSENP